MYMIHTCLSLLFFTRAQRRVPGGRESRRIQYKLYVLIHFFYGIFLFSFSKFSVYYGIMEYFRYFVRYKYATCSRYLVGSDAVPTREFVYPDKFRLSPAV